MMIFNNISDGKRQQTTTVDYKRLINDGPNIIGYLNFKCKCMIDGKKENVRLAVQFQKGGKYYYNIEINKKKAHA